MSSKNKSKIRGPRKVFGNRSGEPVDSLMNDDRLTVGLSINGAPPLILADDWHHYLTGVYCWCGTQLGELRRVKGRNWSGWYLACQIADDPSARPPTVRVTQNEVTDQSVLLADCVLHGRQTVAGAGLLRLGRTSEQQFLGGSERANRYVCPRVLGAKGRSSVACR